MIEVENVTKEEVIASSRELQSQTHPDSLQNSWERLPGLENWCHVELTADDVIALQGFVETSGEVDSAYQFWKQYDVVTLGDIAAITQRESDTPYWNGTVSEITKKYPALLIFRQDIKGNRIEGEGAMLNLGNILDGNHRLFEEAVKILNMTEEEKETYRYTAYATNLPLKYALLFNCYYMVEPIINSMKKVMGKRVADVDPANIMSVPDRFRLLSQRIQPHGRGI